MSKYESVIPEQKRILLSLAKHVHATGDYSWRLFRDELLRSSGLGERIPNMPRDPQVYVDLGEMGFIKVSTLDAPSFHERESLELMVKPRTLGYADYCQKSKWRRTWIDVRHDLGVNDTLRSRLIWCGISFASGLLLGWVLKSWV